MGLGDEYPFVVNYPFVLCTQTLQLAIRSVLRPVMPWALLLKGSTGAIPLQFDFYFRAAFCLPLKTFTSTVERYS